MRYLVVCVLAGLLALPQSVAAQTGEEAAPSAAFAIHAQHRLPPQLMLRASYFLNLDGVDRLALAPPDWDWCHEPFCPEPATAEPTPPSEPAPEEPALQLKLDAADVEVTPGPPRTADGYTLEEMRLRVKRARIGVGVSFASFMLAGALAMYGAAQYYGGDPTTGDTAAVVIGVTMGYGGIAGMIASGVLLHRRKRELRRVTKPDEVIHFDPDRMEGDTRAW